MKKIDLTNQKIGRLLVLSEAEPQKNINGNNIFMWHCLCECGERCVKSTSYLRGKSPHKSCGCWGIQVISEKMSSQNKAYNTYDLSGDYGIGYDNSGNEFWFDLEDYDLIKDYYWYKHHNYFEAHITKNGMDKHIFMHKLIMKDLDNFFDVDHINTHQKFNNRKNNLRYATRSENNKNKKIQKNNTSGVPGVRWNKRIWEAFININKKYVYLGGSKDFDTAVKIRKDAEKKYYKEYSYDASQKLSKENE